MDISLPVSDSSAAGVFSGGASSRSVDSGKFSQTLSKEMSGQHEQERAPAETSTEPSRQQPAADGKRAEAAKPAETEGSAAKNAAAGTEQSAERSTDENSTDTATTDTTPATTEHAAKSHKDTKKASQEASDALPVNAGSNSATAVLPEEKSILDSLKLLSANSENIPAETADKAVTPAALDKAANAAANSVLANGSSNPALVRSNAIHNEIFSSVRTQSAAAAPAGTVSYADSLATGKSLQQSGKNLPTGKTEKADQQLNSFLPAGAQDWKFTADNLMTAVSDKTAKFEALGLQLDPQSVETFSLVNTGAGKSLLAPQASLKSELAGPAIPLSSEFLAGSEEWCQDFGTKIEWLNNENISKAELSLHPAELGVLDITINTEDDRISINIVTHNEKSREMLESSLPRLTELLKSQGLALENSNISHNPSTDKHNAHPQQANPFSLSAEEQQAAEHGTVRSALIRHQGQIDHYV